MAPYYRYGRRFVKKNKYNIDAFMDAVPANGQQGQNPTGYGYWEIGNNIAYTYVNIVPYTTTPGTRKVKNVRLSMQSRTLDTVWYALVYVPEGTEPSTPATTVEGYQPSQYVLMQGLLTPEMPVNTRTRLSRNLNAGDRICLLFWTIPALNNPAGPTAGDISDITVYEQHAICYN